MKKNKPGRPPEHGHTKGNSRSITYITWSNMKARCFNKKHKWYPRYGGRGITVCKRWLSFENFLKDMGCKPNGMTLERVNNNKGYCKSNCQWATVQENAENRSTTDWISYDGQVHSLSTWARILSIPQPTLWKRLKKYGWGIVRAFTTPVRGYRNGK